MSQGSSSLFLLVAQCFPLYIFTMYIVSHWCCRLQQPCQQPLLNKMEEWFFSYEMFLKWNLNPSLVIFGVLPRLGKQNDWNSSWQWLEVSWSTLNFSLSCFKERWRFLFLCAQPKLCDMARTGKGFWFGACSHESQAAVGWSRICCVPSNWKVLLQLGQTLGFGRWERGGEGSDQRGKERLFSVCQKEEGWAGPEHWMWHSLGAEQFLKCCVLPQTLGLEKNSFK